MFASNYCTVLYRYRSNNRLSSRPSESNIGVQIKCLTPCNYFMAWSDILLRAPRNIDHGFHPYKIRCREKYTLIITPVAFSRLIHVNWSRKSISWVVLPSSNPRRTQSPDVSCRTREQQRARTEIYRCTVSPPLFLFVAACRARGGVPPPNPLPPDSA